LNIEEEGQFLNKVDVWGYIFRENIWFEPDQYIEKRLNLKRFCPLLRSFCLSLNPSRAKIALSNKFDLRAFHDQVLDAGALPLDVPSDRISGWTASQK
jgi:hypothetical protein